MSTSSSDSWILIALTILVVLLLFYLSKKMICNSYGSSETEEDSPTTSPSSSTTSFSDYYHDGRCPLDLLEAGNTTSSGSSPETDDVAIGIADSIDYSDGDHRWHHYRVDNQCSGSNNRGTNNNRNYLDLSDSITCNGRRMSCDVGGTTTPAIGIGSTTSSANNRRMDCSGLPLTSSATGSQHPILSSISIIASPDFDRKTMLESQLRNQIAKIVQAESEIQTLVKLLAAERRQELNSENNNSVAATDASLLHHHHHQTYSQSHHHPRAAIPPSSFSTVTNTPTSSFATRTTANMGATVANSTPTSYNGITTNNAIPSSFPHENDAIITPHVVPVNHGDDDYHHHPPSHENNSRSETTSPGNHYPQHHHHHQRQNENFPCLSDFLFNSNCMRSQALAQQRQLQQQLVACGVVARAIDSSRPRRSQCACNLCYSAASNIGTRARRMLMLRRMLLQTFPTTFPIDTNANVTTSAAATTTQRDFLARPAGPSACDVHYRGDEQHEHHVHDSQQPAFSDYSHHHQQQQQHGDRQQNHGESDDPPPYEECIRSDRRSQESNDHNQNLYSNNNIATCNTICDNQDAGVVAVGSISTQA